MSDFGGNFMESMSCWVPSSSPSPRTILGMLNQSDNDLNPITEMFPQTNLSRDQTEKRSCLGERLSARIGFNHPTLDAENINSPFVAFFRNSIVSSPVFAISPGFSPSTMLQSPKIICSDSAQIAPSSPVTNKAEMVESSGEGHATNMTFDNDLPHQPLQIDLPSQEGSDDIPTEESAYIPSQVESIDAPLATSFESEVVNETNIISMEEESECESEEAENEEEDELDVEPSSTKRRKVEVLSNMIGATRTSKQKRVIIQMECEENNPDDGYRWRKYGQKVVKGNPNPRSYYKCTVNGCKVKKHVERGADNAELVLITYDGIHEHAAPVSRSGPRNRSGSSSLSQKDDTDRTGRLGKPLPSSFATSLDKKMSCSFPSLGPQVDMTKLYMTGLSKLPSLPVNRNSDFMWGNDEPKIDVIPDGTEVYNGIMHQLFVNFGVQL